MKELEAISERTRARLARFDEMGEELARVQARLDFLRVERIKMQEEMAHDEALLEELKRKNGWP